MFTGLMTGVSGIRGIVGEGMTPEVVMLWAGAFASWVKGGKVIVGRDSRPSGKMLNMAVKAGLLAAGSDVDDVGVVTTPTCALAVEKRGAAGGIIITASHNPQGWNALKFVRPDGRMLTSHDFQDLEQIVIEGPLRSAKWDQLGTELAWDGADYSYLTAVTGLRLLDIDRITSKKLRVAVDCVNGAGSKIYPELLKAFGCHVETINVDGSGIFPHPPEPKPENLEDLCRLVVDKKCAVGFAVDPDGDRLALIDEKGQPVGEELTLALSIQSILKLQPGPIVVNSLTSQVIDDIAGDFGVDCHRTRVGEANVATAMKEMQAVAGGEGNGGVMLSEMHLVRDAGVGMAMTLNRLASTRKSLSELKNDLPAYEMIRIAYPLGNLDGKEIIAGLARHYDHDRLSRIDGLKVDFDKGWVQVRTSNTEPVLRVYSEAQNLDEAEEMMNEMLNHINNSVGEDRINLLT